MKTRGKKNLPFSHKSLNLTGNLFPFNVVFKLLKVSSP